MNQQYKARVHFHNELGDRIYSDVSCNAASLKDAYEVLYNEAYFNLYYREHDMNSGKPKSFKHDFTELL